MQEVKVRALSEGRAILTGLSPGTVIALVNPEKKQNAGGKSGAGPSLGPGSN